MKAFTYYLYHNPTGLKYYGVRFAKNCKKEDLWNTYFTSCKKVHELIEEYGANSFEYEIRKTFDSIEKARDWEHKVLKRLKVNKNLNWINKSTGKANLKNKTYGMLGKHHSIESKQKSSESQLGPKNHMFGKTHTPETIEKIRNASIGRIKSDKTKRLISEKHKIAYAKGTRKTNKGFKHSPEAIEKIKINRAKQVFSEESKIKMRESAKKSWEKRKAVS